MKKSDFFKILILYYSGVGNTKMVAEKIFNILKNRCDIIIVSVEKITENINIIDHDALVIGFPTIHASPAKPIMDYIQQLQPILKTIPTFIFTTGGLYSANALRILAKECIKRNITPILNKSYRCSATDGTLIAPFMEFWFRYEKKLDEKVIKDSEEFIKLLNKSYKISIPRFKIYSILNYPNKVLGEHFSPAIYVHKEKCISCGKCITSCPTDNIYKDDKDYPVIHRDKCIHCYRCIHHCPKKALSLSQKRTPSKTLYF